MTNRLRNELEITLKGKKYVMRASFEAMSDIEADLKMNLVPLISAIGNFNVGIKQCATIIHHGLRAYGDESLTFPQVGEAVMHEGVGAVMGTLVDFLSLGMEGVKMGKPAEAEAPQA